METAFEQRVMALDLRSRRFSYAIFEGPHALLDWGIKTYMSEGRSLLGIRLAGLQSMFAPSIILIRQTAELWRMPSTRPALHVLKMCARRLVITVRLIDDSSLRGFFSGGAAVNKHDIAEVVAQTFPELSWRLPPRRRPWETEPARQSIFDAASVGVFYFAQQAEAQGVHAPVAV